MGKETRYSPEVKERAVRLVAEQAKTAESRWAAIESITAKIGYAAETLRKWARQTERNAGNAKAELTLDALEQALWARKLNGPLIHHSDHGCQYLSIRHSERLAEAKIEVLVITVGDAFDNALAETINGLFKTEVIRRRGPWRECASFS